MYVINNRAYEDNEKKLNVDVRILFSSPFNLLPINSTILARIYLHFSRNLHSAIALTRKPFPSQFSLDYWKAVVFVQEPQVTLEIFSYILYHEILFRGV